MKEVKSISLFVNDDDGYMYIGFHRTNNPNQDPSIKTVVDDNAYIINKTSRTVRACNVVLWMFTRMDGNVSFTKMGNGGVFLLWRRSKGSY